MHTFSSYAEIHAALTDPYLVPPPALPGAPVGTMAWLRSQVARFSSGPAHDRRRAGVIADLSAVDPAALTPAAGPDDRHAVVSALAAALGLPDPPAVADAIVAASATYFGGEDAAADEAVAWLVDHLTAADPGISDAERLERVANRVGLLIQAADATATLIANARRAGSDLPTVLLTDPPVTVMRRVAARDTRIGDTAIAAGDEVTLDVATAAREAGVPLTFGVPPRVCPGREHALALAAAALG